MTDDADDNERERVRREQHSMIVSQLVAKVRNNPGISGEELVRRVGPSLQMQAGNYVTDHLATMTAYAEAREQMVVDDTGRWWPAPGA